eukprot:TRINITY_DN85381_c0_g1_i1.p1 TRINITY_DN85381_c0_g1~~TRINITY_DN85381_c0_g1_i1.p1  ORF type:complete len:440 (-),score=39.97 TRINITY_DN85381_c0_g1_i1:19-1338(-)
MGEALPPALPLSTSASKGPRVFGRGRHVSAYESLADETPGQQQPANADGCVLDLSAPSTPKDGQSKGRRLAHVQGLLAVAGSAFFFSIMGAGVHRLASVFPATQSMLVRCLVQACFAFSFLKYNGLHILGPPQVRAWVIFRGLLGATTNWIFFFSVTQIPLGDANAILFTSPMFTSLLSCLIFGEVFTKLEATACLSSIVGVAFVSRPSLIFGVASTGRLLEEASAQESSWRLLVAALCLLGALLNGSIFIVVKKIGKTCHWMSLVFSFALMGSIFSAVALTAGVQSAQWHVSWIAMHEYSYLVAIGCCATLAQSLFNFGMQREKPAVAAITRQLDVPFSFFWQGLVFGESLEFFSILGALMILGSTTAILGRRLCCETRAVETANIEPMPEATHAQSVQPECDGRAQREDSSEAHRVEEAEQTVLWQRTLSDREEASP